MHGYHSLCWARVELVMIALLREWSGRRSALLSSWCLLVEKAPPVIVFPLHRNAISGGAFSRCKQYYEDHGPRRLLQRSLHERDRELDPSSSEINAFELDLDDQGGFEISEFAPPSAPRVWLRGPPRGVKVVEFLEFWRPDGHSDCKLAMQMEVGRLGAPATGLITLLANVTAF